MRVRFFNNVLSSKHLMNSCCKMWGLDNNVWKSSVTFVDDESYTHAIIVNGAMPKLKISKDRVLGLAFEPLELLRPCVENEEFVRKNVLSDLIDDNFIEYAKRYIGEYFVGKRSDLPNNLFRSYYNFMYSNNWQLNMRKNMNRKKSKSISLILSNKRFLPGHYYRHKLVELLLLTKVNIDIYGYGSNKYDDVRSKGSFTSTEPYDDYMFTIAIENTISDDYITEKILNPIGCGCIPIYLGAKNVNKYLGDDCCYQLTGDLISDFNTIVAISTDPLGHIISLKGSQYEIENGKACFPRFVSEYFSTVTND